MKTIDYSEKIPVKKSVDVLVAGGGPAGFAAALAAGRLGAKTMIVEQCNCLGGVATSGMMSHWSGGTEGQIISEIYQRCMEQKWDCEDIYTPTVINHDKLKQVMLEILFEAGVEIKLYTLISTPLMDGKKITGVITDGKSGREAIEAKIVIDCTGDGDVAARAGAEYKLGRENDKRMQPATLMFKLGGVDWDNAVFPGSFESNIEIPKGKVQDLSRKILPFPAGHTLLYKSSIPGFAVINMTNQIDIDGTNTEDLTKAEIECRKQIPKILKFLREYVPGYEKAYIISTASWIGIRETRHFAGEYTLNENDILEARVFDDWIATKNFFNFDIHSLDGPGLDKDGAQKKFQSKGKYTIPYRCCLPVEIDGLLLAGRNISGTHKAHSNYRVMPICANMGQGVGTAAALCVKKGILPREANVAEIQQALIKQGVEAP